MSDSARRPWRWIRRLLVIGLVAWGCFAGWQLWQARRAGQAMQQALSTTWPENQTSPDGMRRKIVTTADDFSNGRFRVARQEWSAGAKPTRAQRLAAERFFSREQELRKRFLAATSAGQKLEQSSQDIADLRDTLGRALVAAARGYRQRTEAWIAAAEATIEVRGIGLPTHAADGTEQGVARLVVQIEPAFLLGRDLMTEGHATVEKVLARAAGEFRSREYPKAAALVQMAAALMAVETSAPAPPAEKPPRWFLELSEAELTADVSQAAATKTVELAEVMHAAEPLGPVVEMMVARARAALDAGRTDDAAWWAGVTLNALGMTDADVNAAVGSGEEAAVE